MQSVKPRFKHLICKQNYESITLYVGLSPVIIVNPARAVQYYGELKITKKWPQL